MTTKTCECGEIYGEMCQSDSADVLVEVMPEYLRESNEAAGGCGSYPQNGSVRIRCSEACASRLIETEGEWARIIRATPRELQARANRRAAGAKRRKGLAPAMSLRLPVDLDAAIRGSLAPGQTIAGRVVALIRAGMETEG